MSFPGTHGWRAAPQLIVARSHVGSVIWERLKTGCCGEKPPLLPATTSTCFRQAGWRTPCAAQPRWCATGECAGRARRRRSPPCCSGPSACTPIAAEHCMPVRWPTGRTHWHGLAQPVRLYCSRVAAQWARPWRRGCAKSGQSSGRPLCNPLRQLPKRSMRSSLAPIRLMNCAVRRVGAADSYKAIRVRGCVSWSATDASTADIVISSFFCVMTAHPARVSQSTFAPDSLTTLPHFAISDFR